MFSIGRETIVDKILKNYVMISRLPLRNYNKREMKVVKKRELGKRESAHERKKRRAREGENCEGIATYIIRSHHCCLKKKLLLFNLDPANI